MHYRPHCGWNTGFSLMQMTSDGSTATYFYVNCPDNVLSRLQNILGRNPGLSRRLFLLDILVVDDLLKQWSEIIHRRRDILIEYEHRTQNQDRDLLTRNLHELSRDWHVLLQDLTDTEEQIHFLEDSYRRFLEVFIRSEPSDIRFSSMKRTISDKEVSSEEQVPSVFTHAADGSLSYLKSRCSMYRRWTSNYKDRTNIQINLMFHLSNQNEARTNLRIARSTGKVAKQTQRDSTSMITIAAVTMFFLPVTSVSAVLSTIFFNYGEMKINTSRQWWIFPAAVVPLTIVVFVTWWAWLKWREHRDAAEADDEGEEAQKE